MKRVFVILMALVLLVPLGFSTPAMGQEETLKKHDQQQLRQMAKQTWKYFDEQTDPDTHLPLDEIRLIDGSIQKAEHTSPTNIGMYMMSTVAAEEMGFIQRNEALKRMRATLKTLDELEKWNGFLYNWYYTSDGSLKTDWGQFISSVDNGWYAAGLIVLRQTYPELAEEATQLLEAMDFGDLYHPGEGHLYGGYDVVTQSYTGHTYGMFNTEPRVASYIGIGKGDLPADHWWRMFRTFPPEWEQQQTPTGTIRVYDGVEVFQGHYEYRGIRFVPSWGGSMFEALMPTMVMKEQELAPKGLGLNGLRYSQVQIAFAEEKGYPVWGFSPCAIPDGYTEYGVAEAGTWKDGYKDDGTVTPHASFLALDFVPNEAMKNIKRFRELGSYGKYGFFDSINVRTGEVTPAYLALDQGMILVSIANHLHNGVIREAFHQDSIGSSYERLLVEEDFMIQ